MCEIYLANTRSKIASRKLLFNYFTLERESVKSNTKLIKREFSQIPVCLANTLYMNRHDTHKT